LPSLRKAFNEDKRTNARFADWWEENSKEAYNTGLAGASAAFDNYAKSKSGTRKGPKMGIPRFKSKRKARLTCRFTTGTIRIEPDGRHITLPRIGTVRLHLVFGQGARSFRAGVNARSRVEGQGTPDRRQGDEASWERRCRGRPQAGAAVRQLKDRRSAAT
jgi:hypothetical protein